MVKSVSVGLLGLGTVGSGVVKIIKNHQDKLMHQIGCPVEIKKVAVRDRDKKEMSFCQRQY
ncbi:Homoserine dehydrogenase [Anoxybacillus sp. BCO1]|nr:Homoserine dehydrogenase [Anoxybacillus sp. BCO1]